MTCRLQCMEEDDIFYLGLGDGHIRTGVAGCIIRLDHQVAYRIKICSSLPKRSMSSPL